MAPPVATVDNANAAILRECREQLGVEIAEVARVIATVAALERGYKKPSFNQLNILAEFYAVPRWVFVAEQMPEKYQLKTTPVFRQLAEKRGQPSDVYQLRLTVYKVERLRRLVLELREDAGEPVEDFAAPALPNIADAEDSAAQVRRWLGVGATEILDFHEWRHKLEAKGIFVFISSKYKNWSYIGKTGLCGLTLYYAALPIIIINRSDYRRALSFTLLRGLGHLLHRESALDDRPIDAMAEPNQGVEKWCDEFAAQVLMPDAQLRAAAREVVPGVDDWGDVKQLAEHFKVSDYACLVRLWHLRWIDQPTFVDFFASLKWEFAEHKDTLSSNDSGPARHRSTEVLQQYGGIYTRALFQAYYAQEIGLHKLCKLFGLKRVSHVLQLEEKLWADSL